MKRLLLQTGRFILRSLLGLAALLLVALITVQIVLIVGINLVSTGKGSHVLSAGLNKAMADSGYALAFDALYYDPVRGFTVYDLAVSDPQGVFLNIDRVSLGVSLASSPLRVLDIGIKGRELVLIRLPAGKQDGDDPAQGEGMEPFAVPDIYFRKIILSELSFSKVVLGEDVAGKPTGFSPFVRGSLRLGEELALSLSAKTGMAEIANSIEAPQTINLSASLSPETLDFAIGEFSAAAKNYALSAQGTGSLAKEGSLDLSIEARHDDLSALTGGALRNASAKARIDGVLTAPAIDLAAAIGAGNLKERGLSDIAVTLKTEDVSNGIRGQARIETTFHEEPVTLESDLDYRENRLGIDGLKGSAPDIVLSGGGTLATDRLLFDGNIAVSAKDLSRYSKLAGFGIAGLLETAVTFKPSADQKQSADIAIRLENAAYEDIRAGKVSAKAFLPSIHDPWPQTASVEASSIRITKDASLNRLSTAITEAGKEEYKLSFEGAGSVPAPVSFDGSALLSGIAEAVPALDKIAVALRAGTSSLALSGSVSSAGIDMALSAKDFRAGDLPLPLPAQAAGARFDLSAAVTGPLSRPLTTLDAALRHFTGSENDRNAVITLKAQHDGQTVSAALSGQGTGIRKLDSVVSFPMSLSLYPFAAGLDRGAPLSGTIGADLDLAAISALFVPPTQRVSGSLGAEGTIGGTIGEPAPEATLRLSEAAFEDSGNGVLLTGIAADAAITRTKIVLKSLSANDGKDGTLQGSGAFSFDSGEAGATLKLHGFNIPNGDLANGIMDADLSLQGNVNTLSLSGNTHIRELNILVPESFSSTIPQLNIVEDGKGEGKSFLENLALDIAIDAPNRIFVRGWGLDAEFGGDIAVSGTANNPQFNGTLESKRGRYEEFGKRFTLARANLRFQGNIPPSPYLDIEATTPAGEITGSVLLTGPVQAPAIAFSSTPSLPEDEVLSHILFGRDSTRISPYQAVQLAQTIRRFSGQGGGTDFDPLGMIRSATGLDDISVETDESGAATVGAGKYLTDNVYLEFSKGKAENSGEATIQIEVTPSINIESRIGQDAQGGGGVFWKRDY